MEAQSDARAYEALSNHARLESLATVAWKLMTAAAEARRGEPSAERAREAAAEQKLGREEATTAFGNALDVLERGPQDDAERALACALAAHAVAAHAPRGGARRGASAAGDARDGAGGEGAGGGEDGSNAGDGGAAAESFATNEPLAARLLWLALHTAFDATGLVDQALGDAADPIWSGVAERIRRFDRGVAAAPGRDEALLGAVALAGSRSPAAARLAATLAEQVRDPKLAFVLARARGVGGDPSAPSPALAGDLASAPRGPVATALLAATGLLLVGHAVRLAARVALAYRRPATVSLAEGTVRVRYRPELLGRALRDREVVVPRGALLRATRDVRYPALATYVGLLALIVGSYVGLGALFDGVRAASPSLLAWGLVLVALGLGVDFALMSLAPGARGKCRLLLVSRDGTRLCVGSLDAKAADAFLARLA